MPFLPGILYEDNDILVCYKPAGLAVQSAKVSQPDLESALRTHRAQSGEDSYIGIITRLDQPVEGLLVFAKTKKAAAALSRSQQEGTWIKEYFAVVNGCPPQSGELIDWLLRDGRTNTSRVVTPKTKGAKKARLRYERVASDAVHTHTLLRIRLDTGRHHQIRVQLAGAGFPIAGDKKYGIPDKEKQPLALCCAKLSFPHPETGQILTFESKPKGKRFDTFSL